MAELSTCTCCRRQVSIIDFPSEVLGPSWCCRCETSRCRECSSPSDVIGACSLCVGRSGFVSVKAWTFIGQQPQLVKFRMRRIGWHEDERETRTRLSEIWTSALRRRNTKKASYFGRQTPTHAPTRIYVGMLCRIMLWVKWWRALKLIRYIIGCWLELLFLG